MGNNKWAVVVSGICVGIIVAFVFMLLNTGRMQRTTKSIKSNIMGGVQRTATLYDYSGNVIKRWSGKIDMSDSERETDFIVDGNRVIIHGGIAVIEDGEK